VVKEKKDPRKAVPVATRLRLWVKAGGRCELKHCNNTVYEHSITLADGNFADVAHIIGSSEDGPRGNKDSKDLQIEFSNLMLLCKECHPLIDTFEKEYGTDKLREWKAEHEERIEMLTGISPEIPRSTILKFQINIGDRIIGISNEAMYSAMFNMNPPKYPMNKKGIRIVEDEFDMKSQDQTYWEKFAETKIRNKIRLNLERDIDGGRPVHLSIFGIGPMPLLMYMGMVVGDTIQADIFHANRKIQNTNQTWSWQENELDEYPEILVENLVKRSSDKVAVLIAISDTINEEQYKKYIEEGYAIYRITVKKPSIHLVKSPMQIEEFSEKYRNVLNDIQQTHGVNTEIHILPAMPASLAIECGRVLIPTKDSKVIATQIQKNKVFIPVLRLV